MSYYYAMAWLTNYKTALYPICVNMQNLAILCQTTGVWENPLPHKMGSAEACALPFG